MKRVATDVQRRKLERVVRAQAALTAAQTERTEAVMDALSGIDNVDRVSPFTIGRHGLGKDSGSVDAIVQAELGRRARAAGRTLDTKTVAAWAREVVKGFSSPDEIPPTPYQW